MKKIISGILAGIICTSSLTGLNSSAESNIQNYNIDASLEGLMAPEKDTEVYIEDNLLYVKGDHCFISNECRYIEEKSPGQFDCSVYSIENLSEFDCILVGHHAFTASKDRSTWIKIPLSIQIIQLPDGGYLYYGHPIENESQAAAPLRLFFSVGAMETLSFPVYYNYNGTFYNSYKWFHVRGAGDLEMHYFDGSLPYFIKMGNTYIKVTGDGELIPWVQSEKTGDIDLNRKVDARDASLILSYSADCGAGNFSGTLEDWLLIQD